MFGLSSQKKHEVPSLEAAALSAFRVNASKQVIDQSPTVAPLLEIWAQPDNRLLSLVDKVFATAQPVEERITSDSGGGFWVVAVPEADGCLIVAKDTTLSDRVTTALMQSRTLLRGLLDSAADLAFEVDARQRFTFVSPAEAFGVKTENWLGRVATDIFWPGGKAPGRNPFATLITKKYDAVPVALDEDQRQWFSFNVQPHRDEDGKLLSVRGTCNDITSEHLAARQTRQDNLRLSLLQRVTRLLSTVESAQELLDSASKALLEVLRADTVWAVMKHDQGLTPVAIEGEHEIIPNIDLIWRDLCLAEPGVAQVEDDEGNVHLAIRLERGGIGLGMVVVSRNTAVSPWSAQEVQLFDAVVDVLTAAFVKAELIEKLYHLSSKDELTSLMNRRSFTEAVNRRLKHQCRSGQAGCLMFVDLDHFKEVNDTLGHKAGDEALVLVSEHISSVIRACDYAGRYGGDEFVIWLEDATPEDAGAKARSLIDAMPAIRKKLGKADLKLSASVGVCKSVAGTDLSFKKLAEKADTALYHVKQSGRGSVAYAELSTVVGGGV